MENETGINIALLQARLDYQKSRNAAILIAKIVRGYLVITIFITVPETNEKTSSPTT